MIPTNVSVFDGRMLQTSAKLFITRLWSGTNTDVNVVSVDFNWRFWNYAIIKGYCEPLPNCLGDEEEVPNDSDRLADNKLELLIILEKLALLSTRCPLNSMKKIQKRGLWKIKNFFVIIGLTAHHTHTS